MFDHKIMDVYVKMVAEGQRLKLSWVEAIILQM